MATAGPARNRGRSEDRPPGANRAAQMGRFRSYRFGARAIVWSPNQAPIDENLTESNPNMRLAKQRMRKSNGPQPIKGISALFIAAACFGLLIFLLTPVGPPTDGIKGQSSDVTIVRPGNIIRPRDLRLA